MDILQYNSSHLRLYALAYPRDVVHGPNIKCIMIGCNEEAARKKCGIDTPFGLLCGYHAVNENERILRIQKKKKENGICYSCTNSPQERKINGTFYTYCRSCRLSKNKLTKIARSKRLAIMRNGGKIPQRYDPCPLPAKRIIEEL